MRGEFHAVHGCVGWLGNAILITDTSKSDGSNVCFEKKGIFMRTSLNQKVSDVSVRKAAVEAVEQTLAGIDLPRYSERVVKKVAAQAEVHDRIRAKSLAAAPSYVLH